MRVIFCFPGFSMGSIRLQPWLTVYRVAKELISRGHEVHVLTDCESHTHSDIIIHQVRSLRYTNARQVVSIITGVVPDAIIVSVTPMSIITCSWYGKMENMKKIAFFSYAPYTKKEIISSLKFLSLKDIMGFGKQLVVPKKKFIKLLYEHFDASICQSLRTFERLQSVKDGAHVHFIPPGIDKNIWKFKKADTRSRTTLLYTGSLLKIRGFSILIDAFAHIQKDDLELRVLARGVGENHLRGVREDIKKRGLDGLVSIRGGWIPFEDLKHEIYQADMLVLPFVLVPSELPVTLMESIACGTPVLVTDIDGLPGASGEAGMVVPHADMMGLAQNMKALHESSDLKQKLNNACLSERNLMESWGSIGKRWIEVIEA